jgi:hypothetical protein
VLAAAIDNWRDDSPDVGAALGAAVTSLCATGAELDIAALDAVVTSLCATGAELDTAALDADGDEACEATVCKVVAAIDAGLAAAAGLFGNDPSPQRHEHAQEPSVFKVPLPLAKAPGDPTAGATAAAAAMKQSVFVKKLGL